MTTEKLKPGVDYIGVGAGGAIIINEKNQILLLKRSKDTRVEAGMWSRPGGAIEYGEMAEDAVKREIMEEIGIDIEVVRKLDFQETIAPDGKKHWIAVGYLAKHISGEPKNMEPDKHDEIGWFPLDNLPDNLSPYTVSSLELLGELNND